MDAAQREYSIQHNIYVLNKNTGEVDTSFNAAIKQAVFDTLISEGVDIICVVNVLITDDIGIWEYNRDYRSIDKVTDVLSFPMQTFTKAGWGGCFDLEYDEDTGELPLGDIVISMERVEKQAVEYGNKVEYETAYLLIHSTLHLLGYDHDDEVNEKVMHRKIKNIINSMSFQV